MRHSIPFESDPNAPAGGGSLKRFALGIALVLGAIFLVAPPANAKDEFEDGFKGELGRIAAHEAVYIGRGILGHVLHGGGYTQVKHGGGHKGGHGGAHGGGHGGGHDVDPHYVNQGRDPYYGRYKQNWQYRPWFWKHRDHRGHGHYKKQRHYRPHRGHYRAHRRHHRQHHRRQHRHNRHCRH